MEVEREVVVEASIERVWHVLTDPAHFSEWYASGGADIDLRPGGPMVMRWDEHGEFLAVVERVEPPRLFAFRFARIPGEPPGIGNSTVATFTLTAEGDATRVRVVETGFDELDVTDEERETYAAIELQGWSAGLTQLRACAMTVQE
jgi:uncharacterized protein YndB with AHSA1/START domain